MPSPNAVGLLGLKAWPFSVVPDSGSNLVWADRNALGEQLNRLLRRLAAHEASSLHLLWADFGAGKTHTLLFLRQLAFERPDCGILPVYTVLPKAAKSFVDVYRSVLQGLGVDLVVDAYHNAKGHTESGRRVASVLSHGPAGMTQALEALAIGSGPLRDAAARWLVADPSVTARELAAGSLPGRIRTTDDAVQVLMVITQLITTGKWKRMLLMVDEFQRIGVLRRGSLSEINAGLHTYFNACASGLSLVLSFSFGDASHVQHYLNEELRSRADPRMLALAPLGREDAVEFLTDLVSAHADSSACHPFANDAILAIVDRVCEAGRNTPRRLIQAAGEVFSEGVLDLQDGAIDRIDGQYATRVLAEFPFGSGEEQ